jgi:hypothetical protein
MANIYLEIEEYLWFTEYQQGNVNIAGLVFDDLIEETLDLGPEEALTVYSDVVAETLGITDDSRYVGGQHLTVIEDTIAFAEIFGGAPIRVKQSVLNVVYTKPILPVKIAHMHLDVVMSGSNTFMEEVSSELQANSTYANAVPYYWELCQESFSIDMTETQPEPSIYLRLYLSSTDLVNMRHDITQDYLFNSICLEEFFIWADCVWGWDQLINESLVSTDAALEIIGKIVDEYILLEDAPELLIRVLHYINDTVFAFDEAISERFYLCLADEGIAIADGQVSFVNFDIDIGETLDISEDASPQTVFTGLATESLIFTDINAFTHDLIIEEGIALEDVDLARWVYSVLVELNFDIADIIG